jgi:hypothetical protein
MELKTRTGSKDKCKVILLGYFGNICKLLWSDATACVSESDGKLTL